MGIGTAIVVIALIYFAIVSPGFRKFSAVVLGLLAAGVAWLIISHSGERAEHERIARTAIKELALTDVTVKPSYGSWLLSGTVTNNSRYTVQSLEFEITITDCNHDPAPVVSTVPMRVFAVRRCTIVGQSQHTAHVTNAVPPGQARAFSTYTFQFENLPVINGPKGIGATSRDFSWSLINVSLDF